MAEAFTGCENAVKALPSKLKYTDADGIVTFHDVPSICTEEVDALKGEQVQGTSFKNIGKDISISHPSPQMLELIKEYIGGESTKEASADPAPAAAGAPVSAH